MADHDSGPAAGISGVVEDLKGKAKEVAGNVTNDDRLRSEGEAQQDKARSERDVAKAEAEAEPAAEFVTGSPPSRVQDWKGRWRSRAGHAR